ncbi:unnamed protein product [Schistocephalus solidus]|uniref:Uncharacterized protein n=1 Tax=Schistocephalus solidus TaxID=70667 RepID=A0A183T560_SCHSO|nr:unnamed protein product [Schistocephalus solidus]
MFLGVLNFYVVAPTPFVEFVRVEQVNSFPMELGQRIAWKISPTKGISYDATAGFSILLNSDVIGSWGPNCEQLVPQNVKGHVIQCEVERGLILQFFFTPVTEDFGKNLQLFFYPNYRAALSKSGQLLVNATIHLTRQPKYLNMTLTVDREPDYVRFAPPELNLSPPTFLDGSLAKFECRTDGALPPSPIAFSISCPPPPRAAVEHERRLKAKLGYPYSVHYRFYNFPSPPTDEELGDRLAVEYAKGILDESRISSSQDNLILSASVPIDSRAHDCIVFCRLQGKEEQIRLTVYYQTTLAYLLPLPKDGIMYAGSSMSCYADGYPSPSISLFLKQPLRQYKTEPIVDPSQYLITTSPMPPMEFLPDDSAISSTTRIGLRPDEYSIRGAHLTLAYNATPGVELLLVCTAGNALPHAPDFLGANKTIATARSIGIVLGICLAILLIAVIIITAMVILRRRQKYASNAINTRCTAGTNGSKVPSRPPNKFTTLKIAPVGRKDGFPSIRLSLSRPPSPSHTNLSTVRACIPPDDWIGCIDYRDLKAYV